LPLPLAPLLLALAVGQAAEAPPPAEEEAAVAEAAPTATNEGIAGPPGIPFVPVVGAPLQNERGVFLDVALLSEVRARTLAVSDGSTTWGSELDLTPGVALEVGSADVSLSLGYAPRLTIPFDASGSSLAVLNRGTARVSWQTSPHWTLSGAGIFVVGDYSQLVPASTPGGSGPPPPVFNPVRSFETYPYVGIDTLATVDGILSQRTRLRVSAGYFDVGGTGPVGEANQPRTWGPQADGILAWAASRTATLTTAVRGQDWIFAQGETIALGTLTEGWTQAWSADLDTTLTAGVGISNREVETRAALGKVVPVVRLGLGYRLESRQRVALSVEVALAPYVDTYAAIPYQRFTVNAGLDWRPSDAWRVGASLAFALAPYTLKVPESYGTAGVSASYAPLKFLVLTLGGFSQSQFQGETAGGGTFRQWTGYFSLTLHDRLQL
jgi:hypothetical protein